MPIETKEAKISKAEERKEVLVDFDGTSKANTPKVLIDEDAYDAIVVKCDLVTVPSYDDPKTPENKIVFTMGVKAKEPVDLPLYCNPVIKKASAGGKKSYSNSKLYDIIEKAGLLEKAKKQHDVLETLQGLTSWLDASLRGRQCRVLVKTRNKGMENSYSTVADVVRFS